MGKEIIWDAVEMEERERERERDDEVKKEERLSPSGYLGYLYYSRRMNVAVLKT